VLCIIILVYFVDTHTHAHTRDSQT